MRVARSIWKYSGARDRRRAGSRRGRADVHAARDRARRRPAQAAPAKADGVRHGAGGDPRRARHRRSAERGARSSDVEIGPYRVIGPHVAIGAGTRGRSARGRSRAAPRSVADNRIFQFASIGGAPQDKKYRGEPTRLEIGDGNTIREFVTINRGTVQDDGVTRLGERQLAHGLRARRARLPGRRPHDLRQHDQPRRATSRIGDWVILGGYTRRAPVLQDRRARDDRGRNGRAARHPALRDGVGQHRVGRTASTARACGGAAFRAEAISAIRRAYRTLYRSGLTLEEARVELRRASAADHRRAPRREATRPAARTSWAPSRAASCADRRGRADSASTGSGDASGASCWSPARPRAICSRATCCGRSDERDGRPGLRAAGIGGPRWPRHGFERWWASDAAVGARLRRGAAGLPAAAAHARAARSTALLQWRPDVFVGVDAPDFNLDLEMRLRRSGVRVAHFVSPSIWAWRRERIERIRRAVDHMLLVFPFEARSTRRPAFPRPTSAIRWPIAIPLQSRRARGPSRRSALDPIAPTVALLPGSRRGEVALHGRAVRRDGRLDARAGAPTCSSCCRPRARRCSSGCRRRSRRCAAPQGGCV